MSETKSLETKSEIITRLAKQGGYILLVGGRLNEMGSPFTTHPQILIWDDQIQNGIERKEIPSNTRAILCSKWISHTQFKRIKNFADVHHVAIFPFLQKREIKEMLTDLVSGESVPTEIESTYSLEPIVEPEPVQSPILMKDDVMRKLKRGEINEILSKELNTDCKVVAIEAKRLMPIISGKYNIKQTSSALEQAIRSYLKKYRTRKAEPVSIKKDTKPMISLKLKKCYEMHVLQSIYSLISFRS